MKNMINAIFLAVLTCNIWLYILLLLSFQVELDDKHISEEYITSCKKL